MSEGDGYETRKGGWFKNPFRKEVAFYVDESDIDAKINSGFYREPVLEKASKPPRIPNIAQPPLDLDAEIQSAIEAEREPHVTADIINRNKKVANLTAREPKKLNSEQEERKKRLEWLLENTVSGSLQRKYEHELAMLNAVEDPKGYAKDYSGKVKGYSKEDYDNQGYLIQHDVKTALKTGSVPNPELRPVSRNVFERVSGVLKRIKNG
jgi:hypothetical protein